MHVELASEFCLDCALLVFCRANGEVLKGPMGGMVNQTIASDGLPENCHDTQGNVLTRCVLTYNADSPDLGGEEYP